MPCSEHHALSLKLLVRHSWMISIHSCSLRFICCCIICLQLQLLFWSEPLPQCNQICNKYMKAVILEPVRCWTLQVASIIPQNQTVVERWVIRRLPFCRLKRTNLQTHMTSYTFFLIHLRILKPFLIFYHRYSRFRTDGIAGCTTATFFFSIVQNRQFFICHIITNSLFLLFKCFMLY